VRYKNQINHVITYIGTSISNEQELRDLTPKFYKELFITPIRLSFLVGD